MTLFRRTMTGIAALATTVVLALGLPLSAVTAGGDNAHDTGREDRTATGAHGGRLLEDGAFRLELALVEAGLPPEFRAWAWHNGKPLDPAEVDLTVRLERLGGRTDEIGFEPVGDFLRGRRTVSEPHSFDVVVRAGYGGRSHTWRYASHEGRTRIPDPIAQEAGLATATVGPATLRRTLTLSGRVRPDPDRVARVAARYAGTVRDVNVGLFERVEAGTPLATVVARDSLRPTTLRAPFAGTVIERHAAVGDLAGEAPLFVIADLGTVWITLDAFARDLRDIEAGQAVTVHDLDGGTLAHGRIARIAPTSGPRQNVHLRVPVANDDDRLRPGQFVHGEVTIGERRVERAVARSALQRFRGFDVVYARFGDTYEVRMLTLGMRGATHVEVLDGIAAGTEYVTGNSFLIRADLEKSGVSHSH
ncbi:cation efflux system protein [Salinisphaera sp. PC39]|uniref:efflux RND transporter periplasmic adaptor subunit n=1 Tax=Salinisphaera sp. PC39 TaxID=1304156 RepID=UPI00334030BB